MGLKSRNQAFVLLWIVLSLLGTAPARAWADGDEPARRLTARGVENLSAFAKLLGYVRFFHPSDQAAAADWDRVAIAGVQAVEGATSPQELARTLEDFFAPLSPTLRVYTGSRPAVPAELYPPSGVADPEVVSWVHEGVELDPSNLYRSTRVGTRGAPEGLSLPEEPLTVSLGKGISALLPLTLYRDGAGTTLPHVPADLLPPSPDKPEGWTPSGNDRATRLAGVALSWPVFQHFYPYFDVVKVNWQAELGKHLKTAATDPDERAYLNTLRRLVVALQDGHGYVIHPSKARSHTLPLAWEWIENKLVVTFADPAGAAGVERGDVVLAIGGRPARQILLAEEKLTSGATPQWRRWAALDELLWGAQGEEVALRVRHANGKLASVVVRRSVPVAEAASVQDPRPEKIAELSPGIFYVDIDRVRDQDFVEALPRLAAARGIVYDFRRYVSVWTVSLRHLTDATLRSALLEVPSVTRPDRERLAFSDKAWTVSPGTPRIQAKIAFLTGGQAISAAETLMGIAEHHRLGAIVGGPTAGTNGNVNVLTLPGRYRVAWTGMRVRKQDGSRHHGVGIRPTVPVSRTLKGVIAGRDEVLERAVAVVSQ